MRCSIFPSVRITPSFLLGVYTARGQNATPSAFWSRSPPYSFCLLNHVNRPIRVAKTNNIARHKLSVENIGMSELEILIGQLRSPHSPKRRSAAKKLRKLGDPIAGPALLDALKQELPDARTWETQYQMVMALAHCGCTEAAPLL